jgi:3-deoxy-D-manno-octulosonic-acid transferase
MARLLALFNEKARLWCMGQKHVWEEVEKQIEKANRPIIWVHAASYGEFEQGLPIIDKLKSEYPTYQIWLTFFSPSGYIHRKNDPSVDFVTYLPFDGECNAEKFINKVQPQLILFIKYEFWYYYLATAKKKQIPTLLVSAIFRKNQVFFKAYGGFYRKMLSLYTGILVQDQQSMELIQPITNIDQLYITGDTRFDRVIQNAHTPISYNWLDRLSQVPIVITGSTWDSDHEILSKVIPYTHANWIIVPHHVDAKSISECKKAIPNCITLSEFENIGYTTAQPCILIIDRIGMLRNLYQYANIAYIGGGFTKDGIHNVLEPAVYGIPVIWGPNDAKYREAIGLKEAGGGFSIHNASQLNQLLNTLLNNKEKSIHAGKMAKEFILENAGATNKTMAIIQEKRLLTN